jgi:hypothetical protein
MYSNALRLGGEPPEKKRATISKTEWEVIKRTYGNKCILCGTTETSCGGLEKAHIKAASKSGTSVLPMCPTCHKIFDKGLATDAKLKKLGLTRSQYNRIIPKPGGKKESEEAEGIGIPIVRMPKVDMPKIGMPRITISTPKSKKRSSSRKK